MWSGIWSSSCGADSGNDPERKRCIVVDATRKWSARWYTNHSFEPSSFLLSPEMEEYDQREARLSSYGGSPSSAGSSATSASSGMLLPPVNREPEELPPLRAVKRKAEAERGSIDVVEPEDFLPPSNVNAIEAAIIAGSAHEEEVPQRCR
ncbi:putative ATP-dependent helicase C23E6.02 [Hordeum vulgare]|nr:putative ATP-dependent helicase C23E6.02 [Hordeum vulgare]